MFDIMPFINGRIKSGAFSLVSTCRVPENDEHATHKIITYWTPRTRPSFIDVHMIFDARCKTFLVLMHLFILLGTYDAGRSLSCE